MSALTMRRIRLGFAFAALIFVLGLGLRIPAKFSLVGGVAIGIWVGFRAKLRA